MILTKKNQIFQWRRMTPDDRETLAIAELANHGNSRLAGNCWQTGVSTNSDRGNSLEESEDFDQSVTDDMKNMSNANEQ